MGIDWNPWDTSIVIAAALAAMACALPGVWLVLRRQSMMGDALSHTALPGVVIAVLAGYSISQTVDWLPASTVAQPFLLISGAVVIGVLTALLTEWVHKLGRVESSAALGVVFTSLFALGLLLVRLKADHVDLDPDCVLFGNIELIVFDTVDLFGFEVPQPYLVNGLSLIVNVILVTLFFKELRIAAFDPDMATVQGINASAVNYFLMAATSITVVLAFESVGSILVIGLLIVPAATAMLLTDRLIPLIAISQFVALVSAVFGHVFAKTLPAAIFPPLGFVDVNDAGTSGMIAVTCGGCFLLAFLFSPTHGLIGKGLSRLKLRFRIATDDILSTLYRFEERLVGQPVTTALVASEVKWIPQFEQRMLISQMQRRGLLLEENDELSLTTSGKLRAAELVTAHRLFESYMDKHFDLPADHLHETAHFVEHYLDEEMRSQLKAELDSPDVDPHGRKIPDSD